jgi:hypothetical protein
LIVMNVRLTPVNLPLFFSQIEQAFDDQGQPVNPKANEGLTRLVAELKTLQRQLKS